ncbi:hypothetical protein PG984_008445 [Apiospora sp. TS-2023a]
MLQPPTYFLAPSFRPENGPIRLGSIIAHPLQPHRHLSTVDSATLEAQYPEIETMVITEFNMDRSSGKNVAGGAWAQVLQSISHRISGEKSTTTSIHCTSEELITMCFKEDPSRLEIKERISSSVVKKMMKGPYFALDGHPVYMITGLKIARGLAVRKELDKTHAMSLEGTATAPALTGTVDSGANISSGHRIANYDSWKATGDVVFAYQLLKIEWRGWRKKDLRVADPNHKQQLLSMDDGSGSDVDSDSDEEREFDTGGNLVIGLVTDHDLEVARADGATITVIDDDGVALSIVDYGN